MRKTARTQPPVGSKSSPQARQVVIQWWWRVEGVKACRCGKRESRWQARKRTTTRRDSVFFLSRQSFVFVPKLFFSPKCFCFSPLGLVTHFSLFSTLFTFLTSFSQLASLPAICCFCVASGLYRNLNCLGLGQLKLKLV